MAAKAHFFYWNTGASSNTTGTKGCIKTARTSYSREVYDHSWPRPLSPRLGVHIIRRNPKSQQAVPDMASLEPRDISHTTETETVADPPNRSKTSEVHAADRNTINVRPSNTAQTRRDQVRTFIHVSTNGICVAISKTASESPPSTTAAMLNPRPYLNFDPKSVLCG